jgi:hypothetical protein
LLGTPVERYDRGTNLRCSLFAIDRTAWAKVRFLCKTAPHDKQDLALDAEVVSTSAGGDSELPLQLSQAARQSGWTRLRVAGASGSEQTDSKHFAEIVLCGKQFLAGFCCRRCSGESASFFRYWRDGACGTSEGWDMESIGRKRPRKVCLRDGGQGRKPGAKPK